MVNFSSEEQKNCRNYAGKRPNDAQVCEKNCDFAEIRGIMREKADRIILKGPAKNMRSIFSEKAKICGKYGGKCGKIRENEI